MRRAPRSLRFQELPNSKSEVPGRMPSGEEVRPLHAAARGEPNQTASWSSTPAVVCNRAAAPRHWQARDLDTKGAHTRTTPISHNRARRHRPDEQ